MNTVIKPLDFYLLRLPVLPLQVLENVHANTAVAEIARAIHTVYQRAEIQDAIYLASPELYQEMQKWISRPFNEAEIIQERLLLTLYKYLVRMSSRCTPYGLFAGFATGAVGGTGTELVLADAAHRFHTHNRLDMNYVAEISKQLASDSQLKEKLVFYVNNSLYQTKGAYRYYEYRIRNKRRQYYLVSIRESGYVAKVLAAAAAGATYAQLLAELEAAEVAPQVARNFLDRLLEAQVLLSELEPTVTGPEFYTQLLARLAQLSPEHLSLPHLRELAAVLRTPQASRHTGQAVQQLISHALPLATDKDLIQTDLRLAMTRNVLSQKAVQLLCDDLSALSGLYKAAVPPDVQDFATRFYERYEEQEIPLLEALDSEAGVGYGPAAGTRANHTPLVDEVRLPAGNATQKLPWTVYRQLVFRKFQESRASAGPVQITDEDLAALTTDKPTKLPAALMAMGSLIAPDAASLDQGNFRFHMTTCHGPSAMALLARFAHADTTLAEKLVACGQLEQEAHGEALLAEVVHLPEARVGNVLQRPQLRPYEIPFLGSASVPQAQQLPVSDLLVSLRQGRVQLRSRRLNKVVLPRLTTAHNYSGGLAIYKFLCDLQHQHEAFSITWDWGVLRDQRHLPRVEYKHIILSREQWRLPAAAHAEVEAIATSEQLRAFREQYQLPAQVVLVDADNELLLDFASPLAVRVLAQRLKKGDTFLAEYIHRETGALVVDGQGNRYLNEVILPFTTNAPVAQAALPAVAPARPVRRSFALGSEWTYLKVYCGTKWADKVLADHLRPCLEELEAEGTAQEWFFLRYADPRPHLRLRLRHEASADKTARVVRQLHEALHPLQQERIVHALQYDTYHRELERYGHVTMAFSETVFHHDSQAVLQFLNLIEGDAGEEYRWLFAIRGVDLLLTDFGLGLPEKLALAERTYQSFFREFRGNAQLTRQLNDKYRAVSRQLSQFLNPENDPEEIAEAVALFARRSVGIRAAYAGLEAEFAGHSPGVEVAPVVRRLLPSYLHMFLNRMFLANQRLHELVVYHYLARHYASVAARSKQLATL
ncbi:lantibiotic dehydratase [Hymenobacter metallilatus]|uniref:Lantibiotic dehydratase n=1 Tax=Hymenobacter metallilatus TaxID=2493666 RepID=A0A428JTS5_9BACT|nr:lantibiotic dehydratase [Hymenobacter metallilatus]RSK37525.1 hypothetical protein EI290_02430 [Hymenobacter metallilatus]